MKLEKQSQNLHPRLGTKETFPKVWGMKECSAFRGQDASGMFGLSTDMERIAGEKMKGKLNGKTVQITSLGFLSCS